MQRKQKLELTWIGKESRPKLESRILPNDFALSYHAGRRVASADFWLAARWLIRRAAGLLRSACQSTNFVPDHFAGAGKMIGHGGNP